MKTTGTYSIVAIDPEEGTMGVAVQSHVFSVGSIVGWTQAGAGVIAIQAFPDMEHGPLGLKLLRSGKTSQEALDYILNHDPKPEIRQIGIVDAHGNLAVHTGPNCIREAGNVKGINFSVQANLMRNRDVWPAMANAFERSQGTLAEKLVTALEAGESAGGDLRGSQSAAMTIVSTKYSGMPSKDKILDLRVEDSNQPVAEMRRLVKLWSAYRHADAADELITKDELTKALPEYMLASQLAPNNDELKFWKAVALMTHGAREEAIASFRELFEKN